MHGNAELAHSELFLPIRYFVTVFFSDILAARIS